MRLSQRVKVVVLSLGVVLTFTGCEQQGPAEKAGRQMDEAAQQATEKAKEAGEAVGEKVEKAGEYLDDAAITAKIKADILSDPLLKVLEINVITTNGNVTLSGVVDSKESIDRALEIARRVKEVQSVDNSMVVKGAG
ncbi:MAG: BON domain-containing protein [Gammaproteobacteria bacterium]